MASETGAARRRSALGPVRAGLGVAVVVSGLLAEAFAGWRPAVPMTVSLLGATGVPALRSPLRQRGLVVVALVVAAVTLSATLLIPVRHDDRAQDVPAGVVTLVEVAALLVLVALVARWAPGRVALPVAATVGVAASTTTLRLHLPATALEAVGQCAFLAVGAVAAGVVGAYLRLVAVRRSRAVAESRRAERLDLARDLHDFVAHDVSGIVALSQAARRVVADRPDQVLPLLSRIEVAGLQALRSMDRTVQLLDQAADDAVGAGRTRHREVLDLAGLVHRFDESFPADVHLTVDVPADRLDRIPTAVTDTVHRVVAEALTNVRRHAPAASRVDVVVRGGAPEDAAGLSVTVTDSGPAGVRAAGRFDRGGAGGTGLPGLERRVAALGGSLRHGAWNEGGWQVRAVLPLPRTDASR